MVWDIEQKQVLLMSDKMKRPASLNRLIFVTIFAVCLLIATAVTITVTYLAYASGETSNTIESFLLMSSTQLVAFILVILLLSLVVSSILTQIILKPFSDIDLDHPLKNSTYVEIQPLLERMQEQRHLLKEQNKLLENTNAIRREFTSNVSHEMKTPLQVIGGYAELMENGLIAEDDIRKNARLIRKEAETMRDLIDDVLTLSKLDEKAVSKKEPINIGLTAKNVAIRLEHKAKESEITLNINISDSAIVYGDPMRADQMIYNLVDNAIKYNRQGGSVTVTVGDNDSNVELTVADEGDGIPEDQRERIFERFYRIDESRSRETGGTGLGLAIVKHAVESFNGTISVYDNPNSKHGSVFKILLPF